MTPGPDRRREPPRLREPKACGPKALMAELWAAYGGYLCASVSPDK